MCLYLIIHVKTCQDKNVTCHRNPSPSYYDCGSAFSVSVGVHSVASCDSFGAVLVEVRFLYHDHVCVFLSYDLH